MTDTKKIEFQENVSFEKSTKKNWFGILIWLEWEAPCFNPGSEWGRAGMTKKEPKEAEIGPGETELELRMIKTEFERWKVSSLIFRSKRKKFQPKKGITTKNELEATKIQYLRL